MGSRLPVNGLARGLSSSLDLSFRCVCCGRKLVECALGSRLSVEEPRSSTRSALSSSTELRRISTVPSSLAFLPLRNLTSSAALESAVASGTVALSRRVSKSSSSLNCSSRWEWASGESPFARRSNLFLPSFLPTRFAAPAPSSRPIQPVNEQLPLLQKRSEQQTPQQGTCSWEASTSPQVGLTRARRWCGGVDSSPTPRPLSAHPGRATKAGRKEQGLAIIPQSIHNLQHKDTARH